MTIELKHLKVLIPVLLGLFLLILLFRGLFFHELNPALEGARHTSFVKSFYGKVVLDQGQLHFTQGYTEKDDTLPIADVSEIKIISTDKGPRLDDIFWYVTSKKGNHYLFTNLQESSGAILTEFQKLPGFDSEQIINSMGSTNNKEFLVYKVSP